MAREVGALLLAGGTIFTIAALVTWSPADPSFLNNKPAMELSNACGLVGSWLATAFLQAFGVGAWLVPAAFAFLAYAVFQEEGRSRIFATMAGMAIAVLSFTLFLSLQWKFWPFAGTLLLTGGILGAWLADLLVHQFNSFGSSVVSLLIFCLAIVASTPLSLARFGGKVLSFVGRIAWRVTRIGAAYAGYGAGVMAMRTAHFAGDGLQKMMEYGMERARQRRLGMKPAQESAAEAEKAVNAGESESGEEIEVEAEVVGPEIIRASGTANSSDSDDFLKPSRPLTAADQMELPNVLKKPVGGEKSKTKSKAKPSSTISPDDGADADEIDISSLAEDSDDTGEIAILPPEPDAVAMATLGGASRAVEAGTSNSSPDQLAAKAAS